MKSLSTACASFLALSLTACVSQGPPVLAQSAGADETEDYRISVEIPLEELQVSQAELLKVNELLDERTGFNAEDFQLDEVVLIARSNDETGANAELLVLEWRSGQVAIPSGGENDWFEVRVPAPAQDNGGAWLLDITGAATVDLLVAVLEPRSHMAEQLATPRTAHRTRTIYRDRVVYPSTHVSYWIYEPARYYTVHYHGTWPYRYFIGSWDYRYYDLTYRPHRHHYGPIYRPRPHGRSGHRHRGRRGWNADVRSGNTAGSRRISPELVQLRRNHPHLRLLRQRHQRQEPRRADTNNGNARYREAKRTHPRPRRFHNPERRRQSSPSVATPRSTNDTATPRQHRVSRQRAAPERRSAARPQVPSSARSREAERTHTQPRRFHNPERRRQSAPSVVTPRSTRIGSDQPATPATPRQHRVSRQHAAPERRSAAPPQVQGNARSRAFRQTARHPTTAAPRAHDVRRAPPVRHEPARSNARTTPLRRANPPAQPTRRPAPSRRSAPREPSRPAPPPQHRTSERRAEPDAPRPQAPRSRSRRPAFERRPDGEASG